MEGGSSEAKEKTTQKRTASNSHKLPSSPFGIFDASSRGRVRDNREGGDSKKRKGEKKEWGRLKSLLGENNHLDVRG